MDKTEVREIPLTQGKIALVDVEDYERVNQYKWCAHNKKGDTAYYARRRAKVGEDNPKTMMHNFILDLKPGEMADHRNGDGLDNRKENLRPCTNQQNQHNANIRKDNTSGYKGVCSVGEVGKWQATIRYNGKQKYLGLYNTKIEAAMAYDRAALEYFGRYARFNIHPDIQELLDKYVERYIKAEALLKEKDGEIERLNKSMKGSYQQLWVDSQKEKNALKKKVDDLNHSKGITHVYRGTPLDLDAVAGMLDKEKSEKIEELGKILNQATTSNAHWLKSFQNEQKKKLELQALIEKIQEAWGNYGDHKTNCGVFAKPRDLGCSCGYSGTAHILKQACTEGEGNYTRCCSCGWEGGNVSICPSCGLKEWLEQRTEPKKNPCPDCGGSKERAVFNGRVFCYYEVCSTCKDGTGEGPGETNTTD